MKQFAKKIVALVTAACLIQGTPAFAWSTDTMQQESLLLDVSQLKVMDESIGFKGLNWTREAGILFDTQDQLPQTPMVMQSKISGPTWYPHAKSEYGNASLYIDLGAYYMITDIGYMDMNGSPDFTVQQGTPFEWEELGALPTNYYNSYRVSHFTSPKPTRYIRMVSKSTDSGINELGLYGYKVGELTQEDIEKTAPELDTNNGSNLTAGAKIGANAFCDDPYTSLAALGNIREYSNWSWMTDVNGKHSFNNIVNKDTYYKTLKEMGISVIPCLQMSSNSFLDEGEDWNKIKNTIPVAIGADTTDPNSYALHSNAMYNLVARYGNNQNVDPSTLNVAATDTVQTGLNYLDTVESWNEQDKTWETKASYFTPYEYAAMLSADYDGHEGTIENGGVKAADPNFKLSMGGLVSSGDKAVNYLELMKQWFDYNRTDGQFAVDVINYHDYITDAEAPERSDFRKNIQDIVQWRDDYAPGRDIWCSEFDVQATDLSVEGLNNHNNPAYAKGRADRLLRSFLVGDREGLDRLSMFMLRDEWSGAYGDSGLTTGKGQWDKKDSWYYISAATNTLKNADLVDVYESNQLYVYTYKDRDTSEMIYAAWSPTADGSAIQDYNLSVANRDKATIVTPTYGFMEGGKQMVELVDGAVTIDVTETVTFVKVSNADVAYDNFPQQLIPIQELRLGEQNGSASTTTFDNTAVLNLQNGEKPADNNYMLNQFYHLFDEQDTAAQTPWLSMKQTPKTTFKGVQVANDQAYPYDAVITFDDFYDITYIGLYDMYNMGQMDIIDDATGEMIYTTKLDSYNYWRLVPISDKVVSTNKIRIVKYNAAEINELTFYGYPSNSKVGAEQPPTAGEIGKPEGFNQVKTNVAGIQLGKLSSVAPKNQSVILTQFQNLFDEQDKTPENSSISLPKDVNFTTSFANVWHTGATFPYDAIVHLEKPSEIQTVGLFLGWGDKTGKIEIYNNETGKLLIRDELEGNGKWIYLPLDTPVSTSSLRIVKYNTKTIGEIQLYGAAQ